MLDFAISADNKHLSKQITQYGSTEFSDGHGAAVGSLIIDAVLANRELLERGALLVVDAATARVRILPIRRDS